MRRFLLGCFLTLFSSTILAQLKTDLVLLNLKGPVKKWETKSINPSNSSVLEHKITYFNSQGFKTKEETLGNFALVQNFVYDEQGRLVKSFWNGEGDEIEYLYRTNADGTLTVTQKWKAKDIPNAIIS